MQAVHPHGSSADDAFDVLNAPATAWVDTHAHFWRSELVKHGADTPTWLRNTRSPDDWIAEFGQLGVSRCIYVETGHTGLELDWLARWSADRPVVGFIAPIATNGLDVESTIERWHGNASFRGVRAHFEGCDGSQLRSPSFKRCLSALAELDYLYEFLVTEEQLPGVYEACTAVPAVRTVIEHMGKPRLDAGPSRAWYSAMRAIALDTNTVVKLSLSPRPDEYAEWARRGATGFPSEHVRSLVDTLLDLFGPDRLVWGSDWPLSLLTTSCGALVHAWQEILGPAAENLMRTAERVYGVL
jgi:L-fuconolactonase